ncbi:MAG: type II toxin-antitoxin system VapC family toxin [Acidobacteria bacterium]|nr:type II toxin-antitoxin system VapC family toxin [Acidobacteriota bacterium]MYK79324.1 type II toxin-antitoxin system VapC family toxin [Acidobacteriota bacterium]
MTGPQPRPEVVDSDAAIFVDASVFMYRAGADPDWRKTCQEALLQARETGVMLATNAEVLQEILHHYFARRRPFMAQAVHRAALELCNEIIPVTDGHTIRALELLLEHQHLPARDAIHVATMEDRGIRTILSADQDFDPVPGVDRIDPRDFVRA